MVCSTGLHSGLDTRAVTRGLLPGRRPKSSRIILFVRPITGNRDDPCPWRLFVIGRPAALAALPESYGPLFDRAAAVFEADERVRAGAAVARNLRGPAD